ncbi:MAG TPA: aspartate-semialdehyde dehydrogenase [Candidatus Intestinimonas stercorigallinarum]|nr:aspartate-semialdehyde dehydrogenase [Candidatus Intestinimonas stercorigallinarum]
MEKFKVGVIGGTGMVGQRFVTLMERHPWFELTVIAASPRSAGKTYAEAVGGRWAMDTPIPQNARDLVVLNAEADVEKIASMVDFVFSAVDMKKEEIRALEETYARHECPVISNNSAHRWTEDVPMVIPEVNPEHIRVIEAQRKRLGMKRGLIAVKSNCSIQSYVPALHPLRGFGLERILVCTYQAISGAGKTFATWPDMVDNVIPYIGGEEEKSEQEPMKVWGRVENGVIVNAAKPSITAQCLRVPVSNGHTAAVFVDFEKKPSMEEMKAIWAGYRGRAQELQLPSAPQQFLHYFEEPDRPQARLDRDLGNGMTISIGRLRPDTQYDYKFVCLSHNTLRGAAGGAVELAELLCAEGYIVKA